MDDPNMHAYGGEGPDDAEIGRRWREASPAFRLHGHHSATPPRPVISDRAVCLGAVALAALALLIVNLI